MKIDFTAFLEHLTNNFISDNNKLQKYAETKFDENEFMSFIDFLNSTNKKSYFLFEDLIKNCYNDFGCGVAINNVDNVFEFAIREFDSSLLFKLLFSNESLTEDFKKYFKVNPLRTLLPIPYFCEAIRKSMNGYLRDIVGIVHYGYIENKVIFYLNDIRDDENFKINSLFLEGVLSDLSNNNHSESSKLMIDINQNILSFSYGDASVKAMLINQKDYNSILKSFTFKSNAEKSIILKSFFEKNIPYAFVVLYFSNLNEYIDYETEEVKDWVVEKYHSIKDNEYFKRLANDYSISFSVFVHSIYPVGNICDLLDENSNLLNPSSKEYSTFSFLNWIYNQKNCLN